MARYISPETFGIYVFCLATKEIISSLCAPSLSQTFLFSKGSFNDFKNVCKINLLYSFFIITISVIGAYIIKIQYGQIYFKIILLFGILSIINNYSSIFLSIGEKRMDFKKASLFRSLSLVISLILTCFFAVIYGDNLMVLVIKEIAFSILLISLSSFFYFKFKKDNEKQDQDEIGYLFKYSLRSYFPRMTETFSYKIFEILTASFLGKGILGLFNQTLNIVKIPYRFLGSISDNILFVHLKENDPKKNSDDFNFIQNIILILIIPTVLFFNIFNYEIIRIVLGVKWLKSSNIIGLLSIFLVILPFYNSLITVYQASDNQRYYTYTNCLVLIVQILGVLILPQSLDLFILIYCMSFLLGAIFLTYNINKNEGFDRNKIINILILIISFFILISFYHFFQLNFILFIISFIWIFLFYKNKNNFSQLKKKWKN